MTQKTKNTLNDLFFILFATLVFGAISLAFMPTLLTSFSIGIIPALILTYFTKDKRRGKNEKV